MIRLTTLGAFVLRSEADAVIALPTDKARALCTYLALEAARPHRRETLAALLWPDILHESALTNLRQTLYRLRLAVEQVYGDTADALLTVSRQAVQINREQWSVDVLTFTQLLAECERHLHGDLADCDACLTRLTQAVALYQGELLAGFGLPDAPAFEEWLLLRRESLQHQAVLALTHLADACEKRGDNQRAQRHVERLLGFDPYQEATHRQMMRLLARRGLVNQALAHYDACRRLLRDELGVAPDQETTALYHQIKAGELGKARPINPPALPPSQPAAATIVQPAVASAQPGGASLPPTPFVARRQELARLATALAQMMAGRGQIHFVTGEAGSGKTSLTRAFAQQAQASQPNLIVVGSLCSAQTGIGDPYLPFRELLNQLTGTAGTVGGGWQPQGEAINPLLPLIVTALVEHGSDLLESFVAGAALLARAESVSGGTGDWLARLRTRVTQVQNQPGGLVVAQSHIFAQYTAVLQQVVTQYPLLLILDDLQWADASSLGLLFHLMRHIEQSRLLLLGAYRPEEITQPTSEKAHPLAALVSEARRSFGEVVIDLDQATERNGRSFVDALLDSEPNRFGDRFRQALLAHTKGHPLFTIELLRDLEARGELQRDADGCWVEPSVMDWRALPARVEGVIEARIGRLPRALRELLQAASVEGEDFTAEVVARVQALNERQVVRLLSAELDRQHRLVSNQAIVTSGAQPIARYRFRHNLFQHYLYTSLDSAERAYLHAAVANALESLYAGQREQVAVQLAHHYGAAGQHEQAVDALLLAGERAYTLSADTEAIAHFQRGLRLLGAWPDSLHRQQCELTLQIALGNALTRSRGYSASEAGAAFQRARSLSHQLGETEHLVTILVGLEGYHSARGEFNQVLTVGEELVTLAAQRQDSPIRLAGHWALGEALYYKGMFAPALTHLEQAIAAYDRQHHALYLRSSYADPGIVSMNVAACTLWFLGYPQQARQRIAASGALAAELGHPFTLLISQVFNAVTYGFLRDYTAVRTYAAAAMQLCRKHDFHHFLGLMTWLEGWALAMQGEVAVGIAQIHQVRAIWDAIGTHRSRHGYLFLLAEAYGKAGDYPTGLRVVNEGLAAVPSGGGAYEAELYRLRGEFLMQQGATATLTTDELLTQAEHSLHQALTIAQTQGAKSLELRASMGLSRLWQRQGKLAAAKQLLGEIYSWFSEGFDTPDLQDAQRLLMTLRTNANLADATATLPTSAPPPPLSSTPLVARSQELAHLTAALAQMMAGHGQIRFVTGEAGSGKTALTRAFAQQAQASQPNLVIVRSLCSAQTGIGDPYLPFRELLNQLTGTAATPAEEWLSQGDAINRLLPLIATALVERGPNLLESFVAGVALLTRAESVRDGAGDWLPRLRTRVAQVQSTGVAVAQSHIFAQYTAVLQQIATQHPLLLIIDDLQWADASSLGLLFHLMRSSERSRILILGAYRPEEMIQPASEKAHPLAMLVSEAKRSLGEVVIDLDRATERNGRSFVDALLDSEPNRLGERFRAAFWAHTKGHPLFTIELLRDLEGRGYLQRDASGRWVAPTTLDWQALPVRVEGVIEARMGRLPHALRQLLAAASVEGEEFTAEVVARVQGLSEREVIRRLDNELDRQHRLVSAQGIATSGAQRITHYRFRHNLFQQYVYNDLSAGERRLLHSDVAEALVALYGGDTDPLAPHLARHFAEAGQSERAAEYAIQAGDASVRAFAFAEACLHYEQALKLLETLSDSVELGRQRIDTTCKYADAAMGFVPHPQVLAQIRAAEPLLASLPVPLELADRTRRVWLQRWLGHFAKLSGDPTTAFRYLQPLLAEAQTLANEELVADVAGVLGWFYFLLGRFAQAAPLLTQALAFREQQGNPREWAQSANDLAVVVAHLGQCEEGIALAQRCLQIAQAAHDEQAITINYLYLTWVYLVIGDTRQALEQIQLMLGMIEQTGQIAWLSQARLFRSWCRSRHGEHALAEADLTRIQQSDGFMHHALVVIFSAIQTEIALNAGQYKQALSLAEQTVAVARPIGDLWTEGSAQRVWGQALSTLEPSAYDAVDQHFAESLRLFSESGARLEAARTHVAWGKTLAQRGERRLADEHFENAAAQFATSGLTRELAEVQKRIGDGTATTAAA